ncbi:hypothetical protein V6N13_101130 [Hibiscus sabdariffa]
MKEMKTSFASLERKMKWEPNRAVLDAVKIIDVIGWVLAYESCKRRSSKVGYIPFNILEVLSMEGTSVHYGAQLKELGGLNNCDTVRIK